MIESHFVSRSDVEVGCHLPAVQRTEDIYIYGSNVIAGRSYLLAIAFSAVQAALAEQELRQCENVLSQFFLISQRRSDSCI